MSNLINEDSKLIERELLRKKLYENIISWLSCKIPQFKQKEIEHLMLRYIFNKNITKTSLDDPIFITTRSSLAELQLTNDFKYSKLSLDPKEIINDLEDKLKLSASQMDDKDVNLDAKVSLSKDKILYNNKLYNDISSLAKKNPNYIKYALALNIRYNYIKLLNHGLARTFDKMGYKTSDSTEGFASAFNHYFDNFCSAFPDLEKPFGSIGSFFDNLNWTTYEVYVNPPFDEVLMTHAFERIYKYLQTDNKHHKFIFTIPNWDEFRALDELKKSKWTTSVIIHKKGDLPFIDYMNNKKIIYPCNIAEVILETILPINIAEVILENKITCEN
jgi:hypothetical protein